MVSPIQIKKEIIMDIFLKRIVWVVIIIPAVYLAIAWNNLPETVAMHFDLKGNPDRFGTKRELITTSIVLIIANAVVYLILTNIYHIDPKRYAAENKSRLYRIGFAVCVFLSAVLCLIIYSGTHGNIRFSTRLILSGLGLLFALIGNYMHNIKPNYFAGFRLPWTLENEDNWRKTHLLGGKLWFIAGLVIAVICLILPSEASMVAFFTIMFIVVLIPAIYSYRLYKKKNQLTINKEP
jgi:uncharacterized membrane protein